MKRLIYILLALALASSCSTTKVLLDGQTRLVSNKIVIEKSPENTGEITRSGVGKYVQQQVPARLPFGLFIYNWTGTKSKEWNRFVEKLGTPPIVFDSTKVARSVDAIQNHLKYQGFYNSVVTSSVQTKGKRTKVVYTVHPQGRKRIASIEYFYPTTGTIGGDFIADYSKFTIKEGDYLSEAKLDAEGDRIVASLRDKGYFTFDKNYILYQADTLTVTDSVHLRMNLRGYRRSEDPSASIEHSRYEFGNVDFSLSDRLKLRDKFVKGVNLIGPGETYKESVVNDTYNRFTSLGTLSRVNVEMTPRDSAKIVDVNIALNESKLQGIKISLEASINSTGLLGISPSVSYYHKNIFHGGERLTINYSSSHQFSVHKNDNTKANEFSGTVGLLFPQFLGLPLHFFKGNLPSTDISINYNYQARREYTRSIIGLNYGYKGSSRSKNFAYEFNPVKLNIVDMSDIDPEFAKSIETNPFLKNAYQNHFVLSMTGMTQYRSESDFYVRFYGDVAGNLLSLFNFAMPVNEDGQHVVWKKPYSQFIRGELTLAKSFTLSREGNHRLALRFLVGAGYAYGNSKSLPFERHFWAGGASSLRGWQARSVGPGSSVKSDVFKIPNQTGDMRLEANLEYRFPIYGILEGALFFDAGNIWTLQGDDVNAQFDIRRFYKQLALSYGPGIRINLNFLILRFDLGLKLFDPSRNLWLGPANWKGNDPLAFHFAVGYPF